MEMSAVAIFGQAEEENTSLAGSAGIVARPLCGFYVIVCQYLEIAQL